MIFPACVGLRSDGFAAARATHMSDTTIRILLYLGVVLELFVGITAWRRGSAVPLIPLINLAGHACVVAYAVTRWYGVIAHGIIWYGTDQLLPLYALAVCVFSILTLTGRVGGAPVHWIIFGVQTVVLIAATLFFTFFKMTRMI